ncbi:MAG: Hsp33 family molecular chaperone HslO [Halioglobus sp.]|jgi:molecular chaperone Hsp33
MDTTHPARVAPDGDRSLRFLFEEADIRGEAVHLDTAYRDILAIHQYAPGVSRLLGEFLAAAVLLSTTLKFKGKLILQARSAGQIPLLMVECTSALAVRAIARGAQEATSDRFGQLLAGGQLAITIDPERGQRYQGIVPLAGDSLADTLDAYFELSEQLGTRFWLAADGSRAGGLLLQQLPPQLTREIDRRQQQWEHATTLAATVQPAELLELGSLELLHRLYHRDPVRLFDPRTVTFRCNCSRERTRNALAALGPAEVNDLLEELGSITMDCEFCNQQYRFEREDLAEILGEEGDGTLH